MLSPLIRLSLTPQSMLIKSLWMTTGTKIFKMELQPGTIWIHTTTKKTSKKKGNEYEEAHPSLLQPLDLESLLSLSHREDAVLLAVAHIWPTDACPYMIKIFHRSSLNTHCAGCFTPAGESHCGHEYPKKQKIYKSACPTQPLEN